jgi:alcohol dehydrogenase, propanol-preferring
VLAARLHAAGEPLRLEERPTPSPAGTQVRVAVAGCGMCHTDLHIVRGAMTRVELPLTLGHEIAGWIDAVGPDAVAPLREAGLATGDAVLVFGGWGCGACADCLDGEEQRCIAGRAPGFQEDGGYAEAVLVPHPRHLVPLGELDPVRAAPLADAGATPYRAVRRAAPWLRPGARCVVVGLGAVGQFLVQHLLRAGAGRVVGVDPDLRRHPSGISLGMDAILTDLEAGPITEALGGDAHVVFDVVGTDETIRRAGALVSANGLLMLIGEGGGHAPFGFDAPLESWITTTAWASISDLRAVVSLAREGAVTWSVQPTPLADAPRALDRLAQGDVDGRIVLVPGGTA